MRVAPNRGLPEPPGGSYEAALLSTPFMHSPWEWFDQSQPRNVKRLALLNYFLTR